MFMKYKTLAVVALAAGLLCGCNDDQRDDLDYSFSHYTTVTELSIVNKLYDHCKTPPDGVVIAIGSRNKKGSDLSEDESFQDAKVKAAVLAYDNLTGCKVPPDGRVVNYVDKNYTVEKLYYKIYHKPLYANVLPDNTESRNVVVNGTKYLSPETIDKLTDSVKDCFNAKRKVSILMDSNKGVLTQEDYDTVMKLVLQCKTSKLNEEVNRN